MDIDIGVEMFKESPLLAEKRQLKAERRAPINKMVISFLDNVGITKKNVKTTSIDSIKKT